MQQHLLERVQKQEEGMVFNQNALGPTTFLPFGVFHLS